MNNLYLVHEEDYIQHIKQKLVLYAAVKQLSNAIYRLPSNRGSKDLSDQAVHFDRLVEEMFRSWGIDKRCLLWADLDSLVEMVADDELIAPEEAGYYPIDEDYDEECSCDEDEAEEETGEDAEEDVDAFAEDMAALASVLHRIFGDGVSVHVSVE